MRKSRLENSVHILDKTRDLIALIRENIDDENKSVDIDDVNHGLYNMNVSKNETIKSLVMRTIYKCRSLDAIDCLVFPTAFHMLNSIQTTNKNGICLLIYQPLSTFNSNANFIKVDIGFFKKILTNTIIL